MRDTDLYARVPQSAPIDYARMSSEYPKVKGALTRAENSGDPSKVLAAVERFLKLSDEVGCMPDDWPRWRNALEDSWRNMRRSEAWDVFEDSPALADLVDRFQRAAVRFS